MEEPNKELKLDTEEYKLSDDKDISLDKERLKQPNLNGILSDVKSKVLHSADGKMGHGCTRSLLVQETIQAQ